jgi:hypothetical protein
MTPQEKADELFQLYLPFVDSLGNIEDIKYRCKKCALIAVDEILWEIIKYADNSREYVVENSLYWEEVKKEIEKL